MSEQNEKKSINKGNSLWPCKSQRIRWHDTHWKKTVGYLTLAFCSKAWCLELDYFIGSKDLTPSLHRTYIKHCNVIMLDISNGT